MNQTAITADRKRKFSLTEQDMVHWSGLPSNVAKDELKRFVVSRKIEMYDNYIIVNNIADMQRIVESRTDIKK